VPNPASAAAAGPEAIRPFTFEVSEEELADLRRRINATRWPERETDPSQGVRLETIKALATYWATDYNWRTFEKRFAALPHFVTEIDGVDIHFIHVRSKHADALPLIVTHGWPGSTIEQLKIIEPLTDPTTHGASAADAFHLVIPSLPGHGFSGKPTETGWDPIRIARAWVALMKRLGYERFVAQGGDWGNAVTEQMALLKPAGLLGIHTNMPATVPPDVSKALATGGPEPAGLSADEKSAYEILEHFFKTGVGYAGEMANRPQTLYAIEDSPVGLAAWMLDHDVASYELIAGLLGEAGRPLAGRRPRQRHALLADEERHLVGSPLLGEPPGVLRRQGGRPPGWRDRLPGRALSGSAELGGEGLPEARTLQHGRSRRALCRLGTARVVLEGGARCIPIAALTSSPEPNFPDHRLGELEERAAFR
jgi:pimeloyl-ACP methyl ester carboxylesterase